MNGQLFSIGQAVTPVSNPIGWELRGTDNLPQFGKVYHVSGFKFKWETWWITLKENYPLNNFDQAGFAKVVSDTVLAEELSEIFSLEVRK